MTDTREFPCCAAGAWLLGVVLGGTRSGATFFERASGSDSGLNQEGEQMKCSKSVTAGVSLRCFFKPKLLSMTLLAAAIAFVISVTALAQAITGTLRGQVLDPTGAEVPNANVTVTSQETGVAVKITTTSAGTYSLPSLIPGLYTMAIEASGFKSFLKSGVGAIANQDNVADARMELGSLGNISFQT